MNLNAIIAVLELKGILTREEGERLVEFFANKPQSTLLADAVEQVRELVDESTKLSERESMLLKHVAPVVEEAKAEVEQTVAEVKDIADKAKAKVKKATDIATKK